jgi:hypothetical protein
MVPFGHVCDETAGMAQLARTIAIWFSYVEHKSVRLQAAAVLDHMDNKRFSRAHDECVNLVNFAIEAGLRACFVVRRIEFLDSFSLSIMRECLEGKTYITGTRKKSTTIFRRSSNGILSETETTSGVVSDYDSTGAESVDISASQFSRSTLPVSRGITVRGSKGKVVFLGCHLSLYHHKAAQNIADEITRLSKNFNVKVVTVCEATLEEQREAIRKSFDVEGKNYMLCWLSKRKPLALAEG